MILKDKVFSGSIERHEFAYYFWNFGVLFKMVEILA